MTCKFTHFFPPVQQPRKRRSHRSRIGKTYRLRAETPAIQFPNPSLKKKFLFSRKKSVSPIYLSPPFGIYTQTPPPKAIVQNK